MFNGYEYNPEHQGRGTTVNIIYAGDIGKTKRHIEIIPEKELEPSTAPVREPAIEPATAPAAEPVPA